jgi:diguanylate cyclase (GGDEF)-like protein
VDFNRVLDFVEATLSNEYRFDADELATFGQDDLVEILSLLLVRVESRDMAHRDMIETLEETVAERTADLAEKNRLLEALAIIDELTQLHNRRFFDEKLEEYSSLEVRLGQPLSCIMSDIDHFKVFNDTYGHQAGDQVLTEVAVLFKQQTRATDICARYGGEEYVVLLPNTSLEDSLAVAEKLRIAIETADIRFGDQLLKVTSSFGVATGHTMEELGSMLVKAADDALYEAKENGRNQVMPLP